MMRYSMSQNAGHLAYARRGAMAYAGRGAMAHAERGAYGVRRTRGNGVRRTRGNGVRRTRSTWRTPSEGPTTRASAPASEEGLPPGGAIATGTALKPRFWPETNSMGR
jgi:hypothetical protein